MCTSFSRLTQAQLLQLDSFFSGALCALSGGRLPEALFVVFLLDSKGAKALFIVFRMDSEGAKVGIQLDRNVGTKTGDHLHNGKE